MQKKERYKKVINYFKKVRPKADSELNYRNPYELLVAVVLSAQCTDKRVNEITPALFSRFPNVESLAKAAINELIDLIRMCSYYNNKAKHLLGMAQKVMLDYDGHLPQTRQELMSLPGVGRKSANVMLAVAFDQPAMPVDTHVFRVAERIGLTTNAKNPLDSEQQLVAGFPEELLSLAHHWLILHGRYVCVARRPKCKDCGLTDTCRHFEKQQQEQ